MLNTTRRTCIWCLLAFVSLLTINSLAAQSLDKPVLLKGVGNVPLPGEPDALCTTVSINEQPEIILTAELDPSHLEQSFQLIALSSSRLGKGKVLVFSTPAYFRKPLVQNAEVQKLLLNCLQWGSTARHKRVQVWGGDAALRSFLTQRAKASVVGTPAAPDFSADILFLNQEITDTVVISRIERFVRQGGTLLYGSPLSDMQRQRPQQPVETRFNQLLLKAGLLQTTYMAVKYPHRAYLSAGPVPSYLGIQNILQSISTKGYQLPSPWRGGNIFSYTLDRAVAFNSAGSPIMQRLQQATHHKLDSLIVPTTEKPVKTSETKNYSAYLVQHILQGYKLQAQPDPSYVAPAAATFPGAVPATAARITTELVLPVRIGRNGVLEPDAGYCQPHSTGLYVPAGEKVSIYLAAHESPRHLQAQIGVHSDKLAHLPQFTREAFDLTRRFDLKPGRNEIYSPYGGLLLLNIPDTTTLKELHVKVQGAVQAPRFQRGKTNLVEWRRTIRHYPGPWAELASDNIILTVPSARIRTLDDPEELLTFWDAVLAIDARLADLAAPRRHPEQIIVDQEVAYGYMFTTLDKIVVPNDSSCANMLDVNFMREIGSWGHFHELGHRHQFWNLDFQGMEEVSVNLYTMYVFDKFLHKGLYNHPRIANRQMVAQQVTQYLAHSPSFEKWQADPFLALSMYIQLIDAFGWEPIEQVYRQYRHLPKSLYPTTEAAKRDYWFMTICTATGQNLAPFFAQWQVPIS